MNRGSDSIGWIIRRVIILIILIIVAVLPKIIRIFQNGAASVFDKILGSIVVLGGLLLIWILVSLVFMVINAVLWTVWTKASRTTFEDDKQEKVALESVVLVAAVVSAAVVLAAQFIDSWGIKADTIKWAISVVFPFVQ